MSALVESILNFFDDDGNFAILSDCLKCKNLQPRLLDFFVTQYCKNDPKFIYINKNNHNLGIIDIYTSYKLQLKSYHKRRFNLFEKKSEIKLERSGKKLQVSIAKLNVYKWLIEKDVLNYITTNQKNIQNEYYAFRKASLLKSSHGVRRRGKMTTFLKNPIILKKTPKK